MQLPLRDMYMEQRLIWCLLLLPMAMLCPTLDMPANSLHQPRSKKLIHRTPGLVEQTACGTKLLTSLKKSLPCRKNLWSASLNLSETGHRNTSWTGCVKFFLGPKIFRSKEIFALVVICELTNRLFVQLCKKFHGSWSSRN